MSKVKDLTGRRFGRLTVVNKAQTHYTKGGQAIAMWNCVCDCGNTRVVPARKLTNGNATKCTACKTYHHKDLSGKRFGKLVALERVADHVSAGGAKKVRWKCRCDCGNITYVSSGNLKGGHVLSCGCEGSRNIIGKRSTTHGMTQTRLHSIWAGMKRRCYNPHEAKYPDYGGRGIKMCPEWKESFETFYEWSLSHGYERNLSIDRIDVNGDYSPDNCRWATEIEQSNNRRDNLRITYNGKTQTLAQWCQEFGVPYYFFYNRLRRGWSVERTFTEPPKN